MRRMVSLATSKTHTPKADEISGGKEREGLRHNIEAPETKTSRPGSRLKVVAPLKEKRGSGRKKREDLVKTDKPRSNITTRPYCVDREPLTGTGENFGAHKPVHETAADS